jgi:Pectate lyase superfamily protein
MSHLQKMAAAVFVRLAPALALLWAMQQPVYPDETQPVRATAHKPPGCADYRSIARQAPVPNASGEEFAGPFPSWMDLRRDFGAKGDGSSDDTSAFQHALDALSANKQGPAIWIPAGVYRITQTLTLAGGAGLSIIGENPGSTILKWAGPKGGSLLHLDGVAYSRFDRLTFDGAETAGVLIDQSATRFGGARVFDTGNEYADDIFENANIGVQGGQFGIGAAETSVLRSRFLHLHGGIALRNFNALDWWIWNSYFESNDVGISNNLDEHGAGNFHAFNTIFRNSKFADLYILNTGQFNFRNNYSAASTNFLIEKYFYTNAATTRVQSNTLVIPPGNSCGGCGIYMGNMGPLTLTDNVFVSPPDAKKAAVFMSALATPDCISVGDTFTIKNPIYCQGGDGPGRLLSIDQKIAPASSIKTAQPSPPEPLPRQSRRIFEAHAHDNSSALQSLIDKAADYCGQRPVVHLPHGIYYLDHTLNIPANCNIQLIGDGDQTPNGTILLWGGGHSGPALRLLGPSKAILKEFSLNAQASTGIDISGADQPGSRVFGEQLHVNHATDVSLFVDQLDYTLVELHDFELAYTKVAPATTGVALKIRGGPKAQRGEPQSGRVNLFAGSGAANYLTVDISGGATLLLRDFWYETTAPSVFARIVGNSRVTLEGSRIAMPPGSSAIQIDDLSCAATILSSALDGPIDVERLHDGTVMAMGNNFGNSKSWWVTNGGEGRTIFLSNRRVSSAGSVTIPDVSQGGDANTVRSMLAQTRAEQPSEIEDLAKGITDLRLYRVSVELGKIGIHIEP